MPSAFSSYDVIDRFQDQTMKNQAQNKETLLCVYVTRQVDSNLLMSSTIFRGLSEAGISADMIFLGSTDVINEFKDRYAKYFNKVYYKQICTSMKDRWLYRKKPVVYSYLRHFMLDAVKLPGTGWLKGKLNDKYNKILSFIPPYISGAYAYKINKELKLGLPLIQFWTDPLSLGRCNDITEIPKSRFIHKKLESKLLSLADKAVFCYPLLHEMEAELHPEFKEKMSWSDISYLPHDNKAERSRHKRVLIGLFGAYQKHVRNITPLLKAIAELKEYDFIIRGDGDLPFDASSIQNLNLEQGRISLGEVERLENECDILLSLAGKSGITHPAGKTFYYASYNKPVLHIGDGIHTEYFKEYLSGFNNRFYHCYNTETDIIHAIRQAAGSLSEFKLKIPERMNAAVIAEKIIII